MSSNGGVADASSRKRRSDAKYASNAERQRAYRARRRAAKAGALAEQMARLHGYDAERVARMFTSDAPADRQKAARFYGDFGNAVKRRRRAEADKPVEPLPGGFRGGEIAKEWRAGFWGGKVAEDAEQPAQRVSPGGRGTGRQEEGPQVQ